MRQTRRQFVERCSVGILAPVAAGFLPSVRGNPVFVPVLKTVSLWAIEHLAAPVGAGLITKWIEDRVLVPSRRDISSPHRKFDPEVSFQGRSPVIQTRFENCWFFIDSYPSISFGRSSNPSGSQDLWKNQVNEAELEAYQRFRNPTLYGDTNQLRLLPVPVDMRTVPTYAQHAYARRVAAANGQDPSRFQLLYTRAYRGYPGNIPMRGYCWLDTESQAGTVGMFIHREG